MKCWKCSELIDISAGQRVTSRDECPHCHTDLHSCRNCQFYDPSRHQQCAEPRPNGYATKKPPIIVTTSSPQPWRQSLLLYAGKISKKSLTLSSDCEILHRRGTVYSRVARCTSAREVAARSQEMGTRAASRLGSSVGSIKAPCSCFKKVSRLVSGS